MSLAQRGRFEPAHGRVRRSSLAGFVRGRIPPAGLVCALVASLNAIGWSFTTPPFQVTDEPAHFAYVEQLASSGRLPSLPGEAFSPDEQVALRALRTEQIRRQPENQTIATAREQRTLEGALAAPAGSSRRATGAAGVAASQPPLYYALETIPYELGSAGGVLAQLQLMRLLSALMAGATALFTFLFLCEALPAVPWAWTIGGLSVALAPLLASTSGGVNPDAMLFAVSAAVFYCLARAFRRGLTPRLAATCGAVTAIGLLTKLTFLGLLPGILLAVAVLAAREARASPRRGAVCLTAALATLAGPLCLYVLVNLGSGRSALGLASAAVASAAHSSSTGGEISYVWQLYLPPLPGMHRDFADITPARELWFDGLVGQYGWADTFFPGWVYDLALVPVALLALLCLRELVARRAAVSRRVVELCVYAVIAADLLIVIGASSYTNFPSQAAGFAEPRYVLPLLPLMAGAVALAARGAGRRAGPTVGALIVALFVSWDLFSQLQVIARYYG
jgi:4-amino-4-deoxy-L-arabinose transferase-like glycosyltransferase